MAASGALVPVTSQSVITENKDGLGPAVVLPVRDVGRSILPANYFLRPAFCLIMVPSEDSGPDGLTAPTVQRLQIRSTLSRADGKPAADSSNTGSMSRVPFPSRP